MNALLRWTGLVYLAPLLFAMTPLAGVRAQDSADSGFWPHFLGPNFDGEPFMEGFSPAAIEPVWTRQLGPGCSSVTVADGQLYTMGNVDSRDVVYCLDPLSGEELWTYSYACERLPKQYEGGPNSTPTIVDGRLYTLSRQGHIHCLDAESGELIWSASGAQWRPAGAWWGFSDSPLVWRGKVFCNIGDRGLALDQDTGEVIWSSTEAAPAYASLLPLVTGNAVCEVPALVVHTCRNIDIVNPDTGESLLGERPEWARRISNCNAVAPRLHGDGILFMHSRYGLSKVIRDRQGSWIEAWLCPELVYDKWEWFTFNRQVVNGDSLFALAGRGRDTTDRLVAVDLRDGSIAWQRASGFGNLILAGSDLVTVTQLGEIAWGKLDGAAYEEVHRAKYLNGGKGRDLDGPYWAHPILAGEMLYARSNGGKLTAFRRVRP